MTFVLPGYSRLPIGGYRVVYQYANYLAEAGHDVEVVHPHRLRQRPEPPARFPNQLRRLWRAGLGWRRTLFPPRLDWQYLHPRVKLRYLIGEPVSSSLRDADVVFATAWETAEYVSEYGDAKGAKLYLIQHHEVYGGTEQQLADQVNATWRLPLRKIVISRWLYDVGISLGASEMTHIPNAIDHEVFRVVDDPLTRPDGIVCLYHEAPWKGTADALAALTMFHDRYPRVPVTMFGAVKRGKHLPAWISYRENPTQDVLVREIYNANSIYVSASWVEGWSLPPAEAMACGCLFVGTDSGGCRDYALDGETALLSPPKDPDSLYENLVRAMDDHAYRRRIQGAGTEAIRTFTWERSGRELERLLYGVLGSK